MHIVPLSSDSIDKLREKRSEIIRSMAQNQSETLLVLGGAFGGVNRQHHAVSYAVISVFFELWDRYILDSWSYTFDADGLIFYINLDQDAKAIKNTMIHYEDYHPLGFAIQTEVYSKGEAVTRSNLNGKERMDSFLNKPLVDVLNTINDDPMYLEQFVGSVEKYILNSDKNLILSNILSYGYVAAFTKDFGMGVYGPNHSDVNFQMNYERFIYLLRAFQKNVSKILSFNLNSAKNILDLQNKIESEIQHTLLSQSSFQYPIFMSTLVLIGLVKSSGYRDITHQIKRVYESLKGSLGKLNTLELKRYAICESGMRPLFHNFIPFYQKNHSVEATLLYIISRYDDYSIIIKSEKTNLLKAQFLAKNLVHKEEKWIEMHQFNIQNGIAPYDSTIHLANTIILDLIQRNYLKIKLALEN